MITSSHLSYSCISRRPCLSSFFFFNPPPPTELSTFSLHDALPIFTAIPVGGTAPGRSVIFKATVTDPNPGDQRSEEHTSELQSRGHLVCRLLLEKKKKNYNGSQPY